MKSVRIRSYSGPHFPTFRLNTEKYQSECKKNADQNISEYGHFLRSVLVGDQKLLQTTLGFKKRNTNGSLTNLACNIKPIEEE